MKYFWQKKVQGSQINTNQLNGSLSVWIRKFTQCKSKNLLPQFFKVSFFILIEWGKKQWQNDATVKENESDENSPNKWLARQVFYDNIFCQTSHHNYIKSYCCCHKIFNLCANESWLQWFSCHSAQFINSNKQLVNNVIVWFNLRIQQFQTKKFQCFFFSSR